ITRRFRIGGDELGIEFQIAYKRRRFGRFEKTVRAVFDEKSVAPFAAHHAADIALTFEYGDIESAFSQFVCSDQPSNARTDDDGVAMLAHPTPPFVCSMTPTRLNLFSTRSARALINFAFRLSAGARV